MIIRSYHHNPMTRLHKLDGEASNLHFGFELELGNFTEEKRDSLSEALYADDPREEHYYQMRDGSIPDYGFELISQPRTLRSHQNAPWNLVFNHICQHCPVKHKVSGGGLHVHMSSRFFTDHGKRRLDKFINAKENRDFLETFARRKEAHWSKYLDKNEQELGTSRTKYEAVNFNTSTGKTIELRIFRGTVREEYLLATLEFCHAVAKLSETTELPMTWENLCKYAKDYPVRGKYANLVKYLKAKKIFAGAQ